MRRVLVFLVLVLCSCSPGSPRASATPPSNIEPEEYAVYSDLIRLNPTYLDVSSFVVVRGQTLSDADMFERTMEQASGVPADMADSYRARNAASYALDLNLDLEQDYALLPQAEFDDLFRQGGAMWAGFEAKYPQADGFFIFSRVGFNAKRDRALLSMSFRCGDLCGGGAIYLLVKDDGGWTIDRELLSWTS